MLKRPDLDLRRRIWACVVISVVVVVAAVVVVVGSSAVSSDNLQARSGTSIFFSGGDMYAGHLPSVLKVFRRARAPLDRILPADQRLFHQTFKAVQAINPETNRKLGDLEFRDSRRLVAGGSRKSVILVAVPTTTKYVCFGVAGRGIGCSRGLHNGIAFQVTFGLGRIGPEVFGLIDDGVTGVEVKVGDTWRLATLGESGFLYFERCKGLAAAAIRVRYVDGSARVVSL